MPMDPYNFDEKEPLAEENPRGFDFHEDDLLPPPPVAEGELPPPLMESSGAVPLKTRDDEFADGLVGPDSDLAGMYVQPDKDTEQHRLTIKDGLPPPEPKSYKWLILGILLFFLIVGTVTALFFVTRPIINMRGETEDLPLIQWVKVQITMSPEMRALQKMDEEVRAFVVTKPRVELLYYHSFEYYRKFGLYPRNVEALVTEGMVTEEDGVDGWGYALRIAVVDGEIEIRSSGVDGNMFTSDDIYFISDRLFAPAEFEQLEFEGEYSSRP